MIEATVRRVLEEHDAHHPAGQVSEEHIEQTVHRVLAAMTDATVRRVVVEVAEQLVREEIERIKANPE
jgi:hypothetical protein